MFSTPACPASVQLLARSRIPSQQYTDPLMHIFDEFDRDKNGHLSAAEVAAALQSRDVKISEEQAQMFIEGVRGGLACRCRAGPI